MLTRDFILSAEDRKPVPVDVPEWGGAVHVRTMSGEELMRFQDAYTGKDIDSADAMAGLVAATACDAAGVLIFQLTDAPALKLKNAKALVRVWRAARELNIVTDDDVSNLAGKSEAAPA